MLEIGNILGPLPKAFVVGDLGRIPGDDYALTRQFLFSTALKAADIEEIIGIAGGKPGNDRAEIVAIIGEFRRHTGLLGKFRPFLADIQRRRRPKRDCCCILGRKARGKTQAAGRQRDPACPHQLEEVTPLHIAVCPG